jgi:hypothetical protein
MFTWILPPAAHYGKRNDQAQILSFTSQANADPARNLHRNAGGKVTPGATPESKQQPRSCPSPVGSSTQEPGLETD